MVRIASKISYNDLTGGLNNVNSFETINSSSKKTETPDSINIEYFKLGGIKTMEGNQEFGKFHDTDISPVIAGWEYTKGNNKYMIVGQQNGTVRIYNPVTDYFDFVYKFDSESDRMSFCNMNNGVVITNGKDDLVFYEKNRQEVLSGTVATTEGSTAIVGTSTKFTTELNEGDEIIFKATVDGAITDYVYHVASITSDTEMTVDEAFPSTNAAINYYLGEISPCHATLINEEDEDVHTPIRGLAIQYYNGRLWVGTDNGVFYSQVGLPTGWDIKYDAGVLYSIYNDSSEVKSLGLFSSYMLIHKEYSTYLLSCTGDSSTIEVTPYSNVSCDSQQSWIVSNTKYFVFSREFMDIYPLTQRTVFSDKYIGDPITVKVRDVFTNLRTADLDKIFCVSLPYKRWMIFYMPMVDQLGSGYALIYDWQTKSFLARKVPQEVTCAFNYDNNVYIGTQDGLVLKEFTGLTFNGETLNAYYKSPLFDWAQGYTQSFCEFAIEIADDFNNNFYLRTYKDGSSPFEDRIITSDKLAGDALIWDGIEGQELPNNDTVWDEDEWVTSGINHIRMLLPNNVFDKFQLEIGTNTNGQAFAIHGYQFRRVETEEAPW